MLDGRRHLKSRRYNAAPEASIPRDPLAGTTRAYERAIALRAAGRYAEAERACRHALGGYEALGGPRHPDVAGALVELGLILEARDRPREAARCHRRALDLIPAATRDADLARLGLRARVALAGIDRTLGAYDDAGRAYAAALRDARRRFGPRDPLVAGILNNLGVLRKAEGRYDEAEAMYRRAVARLDPRDRASRATLAHNLGGIEHARGRFARAEPHARRAVELRKALHGPGHPAVAADQVALAAILDGRGRFTEAARIYRRALTVLRRRLGARCLEVGLALAGLGAAEQQRGRLGTARRAYLEALAIQETLLGGRHVDVAMTVNNLAVLERDDGNLDRAEALFRRASATFRLCLGEAHPHSLLAEANRRAVHAERTSPPDSPPDLPPDSPPGSAPERPPDWRPDRRSDRLKPTRATRR
jgi:tetratricopeptide (TPR) repeat protein